MKIIKIAILWSLLILKNVSVQAMHCQYKVDRAQKIVQTNVAYIANCFAIGKSVKDVRKELMTDNLYCDVNQCSLGQQLRRMQERYQQGQHLLRQ